MLWCDGSLLQSSTHFVCQVTFCCNVCQYIMPEGICLPPPPPPPHQNQFQLQRKNSRLRVLLAVDKNWRGFDATGHSYKALHILYVRSCFCCKVRQYIVPDGVCVPPPPPPHTHTHKINFSCSAKITISIVLAVDNNGLHRGFDATDHSYSYQFCTTGHFLLRRQYIAEWNLREKDLFKQHKMRSRGRVKRRALFAETGRSMSHYTSTSMLGSFCVKYTRGNQLSKEGMYQWGIKYDGLIVVYEKKGGPSTPLWVCPLSLMHTLHTVLVYRCDFLCRIFSVSYLCINRFCCCRFDLRRGLHN